MPWLQSYVELALPDVVYIVSSVTQTMQYAGMIKMLIYCLWGHIMNAL